MACDALRIRHPGRTSPRVRGARFESGIQQTTALWFVLLLAGCTARNSAAPIPSKTAAALTVTSPAFREGRAIPEAMTCDGSDQSPELAWSGEPAGTRSFAL